MYQGLFHLASRHCHEALILVLYVQFYNGFLIMALPPQKFREIVFQLLYSQDFAQIEANESIPFMMNELKVTKRVMLDAHERIYKILEKYAEIDRKLETASTSYSFERISRVEKTILRLGVFELLFDEAIPEKVAIAEAIRLCRKFGTPESAHFVNAILDDIYKRSNEPVSV